MIEDCYFEDSFKAAEKANRDFTKKMIIKSPKSKSDYKIKRYFSKFLSNGENEARIIELLFQKIKEKRLGLLNTHRR